MVTASELFELLLHSKSDDFAAAVNNSTNSSLDIQYSPERVSTSHFDLKLSGVEIHKQLNFETKIIKSLEFKEVTFKEFVDFSNLKIASGDFILKSCRFEKGLNLKGLNIGFVTVDLSDTLICEKFNFESLRTHSNEKAATAKKIDFSHTKFRDVKHPIVFDNSKFMARDGVFFTSAEFDCQVVRFKNCHFDHGAFHFDLNKAQGDRIIFDNSHFGNDIFLASENGFKTEVSFKNATFENVDFGAAGCRFEKGVDFSNARFENSLLDFKNSNFADGLGLFSNVKADGTSFNFEDTKHKNVLNFEGANIEHSLNFDGAIFERAPDLRRTSLKSHVTFQKVGLKPINFNLSDSELVDEEDRFRRLKELAHNNKDRDNEINFLESELTIHAHLSNSNANKAFVWLYRYLSDFGRSVASPAIWATGVCLLYGVFFILYGLICGQIGWPVEAAFRLSLAAILPTFGYNRSELIELKQTIFGEHHSLLFDVLVYSETALGLLFLFLIGLALRNRFRI